MKETYQKVTSENGQAYMMLTDGDTELKSVLSWKGRVIFDILKEQQPERFSRMKQSGELIPFLQKITREYYDLMNHYLTEDKMMETEAEEIAWPQVTKMAGLD